MKEKKTQTSYFMDKLFPTLINATFSAGIVLIIMYFRLNAVADAVEELKRDTVEKDVQTEINKNLDQKLDHIDKKMDTLLDHFKLVPKD